MFLKQSTSVQVHIGPFMDKDDAVTPETTVTLSGADQAEVLKQGNSMPVNIGTNSFTHTTDSAGWYLLTLGTGDTDTLGNMEVVVQDADLCLPVRKSFFVLPADQYEAMFGTTTPFVDSSGDVTIASTSKTGFALSSTGADLILKSSTFALAMADAVWDEDLTMHVSSNTAGDILYDWVDSQRLDLIIDTIASGVSSISGTVSTISSNVITISTSVGTILGHTSSIDVAVDTINTNTQAIILDTAELQTDDVPGLIAALKDFDPASDAVANVTLVGTTTTNTDMRGTDSAATAASLVLTDIEIAAIKAKTDLISTSTSITVVDPVVGTTVTLVRGDTYHSDDSRELTFTSDGWPTLTGATVELTAKDKATGVLDLGPIAGTVISSTEVNFNLTSTQTGALDLGERYKYDVQATLTSGSIITLANGPLNVVEDITPDD